MTKYCKGCGVLLQNEDENALGYVPTLDTSYCQRCYRIRHYGDVTINMQQGIESNATLEKSIKSMVWFSGLWIYLRLRLT